MLCHVCERDAIGQCKSCAKFYCRDHGDVYCVHCADAARSPEAIRRDPDPVPRLAPPRRERAEAPRVAGPPCYQCGSIARGACARCGRFYCSTHGGRASMFDQQGGGFFGLGGRLLCDDCHQWSTGCGLIWLFIVVPILLLIVFGIMAR